MARARNIKPAFFINDKLGELEPVARLLFIGLWTIADYKGELEWRPARIKAQLLPYDNCNIQEIVINLDKSGFVTFYSDGVDNYLKINNFEKHQNPHPNEKKKGSEIPSYTEQMRQLVEIDGVIINRDKSRQVSDKSVSDNADSLSLIPDTCSLKPDSLEIGAEKNAPVKRKRFTPPTFQEASDYFFEKCGDSSEAQKFIDFYQSKDWFVGKNKMKDWKAAIRSWVSRNKEKRPSNRQSDPDLFYEQLKNTRFE